MSPLKTLFISAVACFTVASFQGAREGDLTFEDLQERFVVNFAGAARIG